MLCPQAEHLQGTSGSSAMRSLAGDHIMGILGQSQDVYWRLHLLANRQQPLESLKHTRRGETPRYTHGIVVINPILQLKTIVMAGSRFQVE